MDPAKEKSAGRGSFDGNEIALTDFGLFLRNGESQHPVVVFCFDLVLRHVVADVIASLAGLADLLADIAGIFAFLFFLLFLGATDGQISVCQRNFDLIFPVAGDLDFQFIIFVRLLDVGFQILLFVQEHGFEKVVVKDVEKVECVVVSFLQIIFHNIVLLLMDLRQERNRVYEQSVG